MSYINYLNSFWQLRQDEFITSTEADLYFALLQIANLHKWEDEFSASLGRLESMTEMSRHTIIKARNRLVELGLIVVSEGKKGRGKNANYSLIKGAEKSAIKCANKKCKIAPFNDEKGAIKSANMHLLEKEKKESFPPDPLYKEKKEIYKEKKNLASLDTRDTHTRERSSVDVLEEYFGEPWIRERLMKQNGIHSAEEYESLMRMAIDDIAIKHGTRDFEITNDTRQHAMNLLRIKKQNQNENHIQNNKDKRRATDVATSGEQDYRASF
jgi:hypothetical protein